MFQILQPKDCNESSPKCTELILGFTKSETDLRAGPLYTLLTNTSFSNSGPISFFTLKISKANDWIFRWCIVNEPALFSNC